VLVVDDDPQVRRVITWALEDEGYAVRAAADGREALDRAAEHVPDLVVLDIEMPVLDGYAAARELRTRYGASLPILAITADGHAPLKARRLHANAFVRKPFRVDALLAAVRAVITAPDSMSEA
jgi:CheY-like chemotaxis protein